MYPRESQVTKKNQIKNVASLTGNSLVLPREMIIWSCWIAHPIELHIVLHALA